MIVPNYIPEPIEVPGAISEQKYLVRIAYIRRVTLNFFLSVVGVCLTARIPFPAIGLAKASLILVGCLLFLEIWRILARSKKIEATVSTIALPLVILATGFTMSQLSNLQWPSWQIAVGTCCALIYTTFCGKDYSFLGNLLLSLIVSSVVIAAVCTSLQLEMPIAAFALGTNAIFLTYLLYDLASLLSRRRVGEEWAAVTDLYRDVFNFFGYFVRVVRHWRKHRLWSVPTSIELPWNQR